jgi:hypothetical protein
VASNIGSSQSDTGLRAAVSGEPPVVSQLEFTHFYGDLLDRMSGGDDSGKACENELQEFFGQFADGIGGDTACWMSQAVGGAVSNLMSNSSSLCYLKNIPLAESGVTISPAGLSPDSIFAKEAADKVVKVSIQEPVGEGETDETIEMNVFIKVSGSDNADVGADRYKVTLWFCEGGNEISGYETFLVDTAAKTFESSGVNDDDWGKNSFATSAFINIASDGTVTYDTSKARSATVQYEGGDGNKNKSMIEISGDNILTARDMNESDSWGSNKNFSKAEIAGEGVSTLKFLQGAIRGRSMPPEGESWDPHNYFGAVEWQNTVYRSVGSSSLLTAIPSNYVDAEFFSTGASVESDFSGLSCDEPATVEISMDFGDPGVTAIQAVCESDRFQWSNICYSSEVNDIRDIVNASWESADLTCGS